MARGKIKRWFADRGTGYITAESGADVFFGDRDLSGLAPADLKLGLAVEFDLTEGPKGPRARRVRAAASAAGGGPVPPPSPSGAARQGPTDLSREVPLPYSLRDLLRQVPVPQRHPGLQLDKYGVPCANQQAQREALTEVVRTAGDAELLRELAARRKELFRPDVEAGRAFAWSGTTAGPLTLHLARASALENAGLCLHPVYGFGYLPGAGLKGMARAYAETVWLPMRLGEDWTKARDSQWNEALDTMDAVFGFAPHVEPRKEDREKMSALARAVNDRRKERHRRRKDAGQNTAAVGGVIFHDAWPGRWPRLLVDIVNNHHPKYYQGEDAPGDWDTPKPVYFLAIAPGTAFEFAVAKRRPGVADETLGQAREWLGGALTLLGCGAKTAAGYGGFRTSVPLAPYPNRATSEVILELVTPAFLAGASQEASDCDLRTATLRGLLRWWWRTFHTGFVDVPTLRRMETAVWGSTEAGAAIRIVVEPIVTNFKPAPCGFKRLDKDAKGRDVLIFDEAFLRAHKLTRAPKRTTQGLAYAAYGMDEMPAGKRVERRQRWYAAAGMKWHVHLIARPSSFEGRLLDPQLILDQARLALWWFCRIGGVGSKARNGFGSFADPAELAGFDGIKWLNTWSKPFRAACGVPEQEFSDSRVSSPSLGQMRNLAHPLGMDPCLEVPTPWSDPWRILDEIGAAMQAFAQAPAQSGHGRHCDAKRHLGLPRKLHGPLPFKLPHQERWEPPIDLAGAHGDRHAAPIWYHVARGTQGLTVRVAVFPTAETRETGVQPAVGLEQSRSILEQLLRHLQSYLSGRASGG